MAKSNKKNTTDPEVNLTTNIGDGSVPPDVTEPDMPPANEPIVAPPHEPGEDSEIVIEGIGKLKDKNQLLGCFAVLGPRELFWRLPSGRICIDGFGSPRYCEIPEGITDDDFEIIKTALELGRIDIVDKKPKDEAITPFKSLNTDDHIYARRFLDERDTGKLADGISKSFSVVFLNACYDVESTENKRKEVIEMITAKLSSIKG